MPEETSYRQTESDISMDNLFKIEKMIQQYWKMIDLDALIKEKEAASQKVIKMYVGPSGPATNNSKPSIHHVYMKTIRDVMKRFYFLNGYRIENKMYWEAHGSSVEKQAKKELGLLNQSDIYSFGIEEFCDYCSDSLFNKYEEFQKLSIEMGELESLNSKLTTADIEYTETVWWLLQRMYRDNLICEGNELVNYCSDCGNIVNDFEADKYLTRENSSGALFMLPVIGEDNTFLGLDCNDVRILPFVQGVKFGKDTVFTEHHEGESIWIISSETAEKYQLEGEILPYSRVEEIVKRPIKFVNCEISFLKNVSSRNTIVFFAPGYDRGDFDYAYSNGLEIINYLTTDGESVIDGVKHNSISISGKAEESVRILKERNQAWLEHTDSRNSYKCPYCNKHLVKAMNKNLVIKTSSIKKLLINNAQKINWIPEDLGKKRLLEWLDNLKDWNISRNRTFGTPIPLFKCKCGYSIMLGSVAEFGKLVKEDKADIKHIYSSDLDKYKIMCPNCHELVSRVPYTLDCWFDSGAFPVAQYHYPFDNSDLNKECFVADVIIEGLDQTRGWLYAMLVITSYLFDQPPAKCITTVNMLLDENGKKMSKVRGTIVSPFDLMERTGADCLRWSLLRHSPVWSNVNFKSSDVYNVQYHFIDKLFSIVNYINRYDISQLKINDKHALCEWLEGKTNILIQRVKTFYEEGKLNMVCLEIENFVDRVISKQFLFYVKNLNRSAEEFIPVLKQTYDQILLVIAPFMPHLSDYLYSKLHKDENKSSIHLAEFPVSRNDFSQDIKLLDKEIELLDWVIHTVISLKENNLSDVSKKIVVLPQHYDILVKSKEILLAGTKCTDLICDSQNQYFSHSAICNKEKYGSILKDKLKEYSTIISKLDAAEIEVIIGKGLIIKDNREITSDMIIREGNIRDNYLGRKEKDKCVVLI